MSKEEIYEKLAILFLKRLILIEKDLNLLQNELEETAKKRIVKIQAEANDIIPYLEIIDLLETDDRIFNDLTNIINNCEYKDLEKKIQRFLKSYIQ